MSDHAVGPGWWLASDGRWYPPETHPTPGGSLAEPTNPRSSGADRADGRGHSAVAVATGAGPAPPNAAERSSAIPAPAGARGSGFDPTFAALAALDDPAAATDEPVFPWGRTQPRFEEAPARRWRRWWVFTGACLLFLACGGAVVMVLVDDGPRLTGRVEDASPAGPPAVRPTTATSVVDTSVSGVTGEAPAPAADRPADVGGAAADETRPPTWRGRREGDQPTALGATAALGAVAATAHRIEEVTDPSPVDPGRFLRVEVSIENTGTDLRLYNERLDLRLIDRSGAATDPATPATPSLGAGVLAPGDEVVGWVYFPMDGLADGEAHVVYEPDTSIAARAVWEVPD